MDFSSIGKKVRQGTVWLTMNQVLAQIFTFVSGIVLARLLFPEDYGLKALAVTVSSLVAVIGSVGTDTMLIQQHKDFDKYANAGFLLNIVVGICLFIIQIGISPFAGHFYANPKVTQLLMVSALGYLIAPIGSIHRTILIKKMDFRKKTIVDITKVMFTAFFSIIFGFSGMGVWSFIIPPLISACIEVGLLWRVEPWRFSKGPTFKYWRDIFHYGRNILGVHILWYIENNVDYFLIGKFLSVKALGLYYFAFEKSFAMVSRFLQISDTLSFPVFSELKVDPVEFKNKFFKYASLLSLITFPLIFLLSSAGTEFILVLFGEKWNDAILPFVLISFSTIFRPIGSLCYQVANAAGRPDFNFKWKLFTVPVNTAAIFVGLQFGIVGIAIATLLYRCITIPIYAGICMKIMKWPNRALVKALSPAFICGLLMAGIISFLRLNLATLTNFPDPLKLLICAATGITSYLVTLYLFFRKDFQTLTGQLTSFVPRPLRGACPSK